jgi:hypothetical protein
VIYVLEALPALLLAGALAFGAARATRAVARRRARWQPRVRSGQGSRVFVEVAREGEPVQVVAELDPAADDFDEHLFEARARAENLASALNVARR